MTLARLVVVQGPQKGISFDLDRTEVAIGRESSNHIEVKDLSVSRRHCVIRSSDSGFTLSSLENTNGTRINGIPIAEHRLADGDEITIGGTTFRFFVPEMESSPLPLDMEALSLGATTRLPMEQLNELQAPADRQLNGLLGLFRALTGASEEEAVQRLFVDAALYFTGADRAAFARPDPAHGWNCSAARDASGWLNVSFAISSTVLKEVEQSRSAILVSELKQSNVLSASLRNAGVRSLLALPMHVAGNLYGVLYLDSSQKQLTSDHLHWLASASGMAAVVLETLLRVRFLKQENQHLKKEAQSRYSFIGVSAPMREVYHRIDKIAPSDSTVLIFGESGTGKELAARAIHENSPRRVHRFVPVNCALLNEALLESDLFGHEKGAFTGAVQQKKGRLELADEGTLFLDELGELSLSIQAKLLRVIQERQFERLGGTRPISVNVRIVGATHRDLEEAVAAKIFRQDLYFRLNVVSLVMPPLRDRPDDIPALADYLLQRCAERSRRKVLSIEPEAMLLLKSYSWPGNVRELENVLEHAVVMGEDQVLRARDLPESLFESGPSGEGAEPRFYHELNRAKQRIIREALEAAHWNYTQAAVALGINRTYLHRLVRSLGIVQPGAKG
jgi:transcriptional regulator with GAF, ATPase, and Fis domain